MSPQLRRATAAQFGNDCQAGEARLLISGRVTQANEECTAARDPQDTGVAGDSMTHVAYISCN